MLSRKATLRHLSPQRGVALVLVVWFLAGLSILVAASVSVSRSDTRMAQLHVAKAKVAAAGDGAIQVALAQNLSGKSGQARRAVVTIGELDVEVSLVPISRLININRAPLEVLEPVFRLTGDNGKHSPNELARAVVEWRSKSPRDGGGRFYSIEDLLRVDGISRTTLDYLQDFVVVGVWATGGADWDKMPSYLRNVSAGASPAQLRQAVARSIGETGGRASRDGRAEGLYGVYRADAVISYGDVSWLRRKWVRMSAGRDSNLPWRFVRTEAPRVIARG